MHGGQLQLHRNKGHWQGFALSPLAAFRGVGHTPRWLLVPRARATCSGLLKERLAFEVGCTPTLARLSKDDAGQGTNLLPTLMHRRVGHNRRTPALCACDGRGTARLLLTAPSPPEVKGSDRRGGT